MLSADKEVESCCNLPYNGADAFVCVIPIVNLLPPSIRRNSDIMCVSATV